MMEFRNLGAQYSSLQGKITTAIESILSTGRFIGGDPVLSLERALADYVGTKHCVSCGNGTDALQLALMAWGVGQGDAVFVPDFTFFSSGEVVAAVGATPVFVDVDEMTFNLDPAKFEDAIEDVRVNTDLVPRAVIAVDLFGLPADYPSIREICDRRDLLLLEDAAQGFGGSINGRMTCSFGDISTTSFFPAKPLGCYGDGGAIFTDDDEWAALMRSYAVHGKGTMKYDNVRIGMNSRLDTIQAAILRVKFDAFIGHEIEAVNRAASFYSELLEPIAKPAGMGIPCTPEGYVSSWAQYTLRLPGDVDRGMIQEGLRAQGIPSMVYYPKPMHEQGAFRDAYVMPSVGCSVTERLCGTVLSIPVGPYITEGEQEAVVAALESEIRFD